MKLAKNARATTLRLFNCDPAPTTDEDIAGIYERAFKQNKINYIKGGLTVIYVNNEPKFIFTKVCQLQPNL